MVFFWMDITIFQEKNNRYRKKMDGFDSMNMPKRLPGRASRFFDKISLHELQTRTG